MQFITGLKIMSRGARYERSSGRLAANPQDWPYDRITVLPTFQVPDAFNAWPPSNAWQSSKTRFFSQTSGSQGNRVMGISDLRWLMG